MFAWEWMQGAYSAVTENPIAEAMLDCLDRLVTALCSVRNFALLCRLPYADALHAHWRDGR